jgi:hypothetical protein
MITKRDQKPDSIDSLTDVFMGPVSDERAAQIPFQMKSLALLVREGYPLYLAEALVRPDYAIFKTQRKPGGPGLS